MGTLQFSLFIPEVLRQQFKGRCAERGVNMSRVIIGIMRGVIGGTISLSAKPESEKDFI